MKTFFLLFALLLPRSHKSNLGIKQFARIHSLISFYRILGNFHGMSENWTMEEKSVWIPTKSSCILHAHQKAIRKQRLRWKKIQHEKSINLAKIKRGGEALLAISPSKAEWDGNSLELLWNTFLLFCKFLFYYDNRVFLALWLYAFLLFYSLEHKSEANASS